MAPDPEAQIQTRYEALVETLNEAQRRLWAAAEARSFGRGGIAAVARATGMSRNTVLAGLKELEDADHRERIAS